MDLQKAKIYLDKITREFARMSKDPENVVRIERDIMLANIRELYAAFLEEAAAPAPKPVARPAEPAPVAPPPPPRPVVVEQPAPAPEPPRPVAPAPLPEPIAIAPKMPVSEPVAPPPPPPPPPLAPQPEPPKPAPVVPTPQPAAAPPPPSDVEVLFEQKQARELSEKLAETPIANLSRGIALNDRLLFTAELFGKNPQAYDEAIMALNGFSVFEQAKSFLIEHCVGRFDWLDKARAERAKEFIRLVRRRYK